jgi:hypothetical protein
MHTQTIHDAFLELIEKPRVHHMLKITGNHAGYMRWRVRHNLGITLDTKIKYLQRAGFRLDQFRYTDADILDAIKFTLRSGAQAKEFGAAYIFDKWTRSDS